MEQVTENVVTPRRYRVVKSTDKRAKNPFAVVDMTTNRPIKRYKSVVVARSRAWTFNKRDAAMSSAETSEGEQAVA